MSNSLVRCSRTLNRLSRHRAQHLAPWGSLLGIHVRDRLGERRLSGSPKTTRKKATHDAVVLRTLQPERLAAESQPIIDLAELSFPTVYPLFFDKPMVLFYANEDLPPAHPVNYLPFPQNAKGFFYYHRDPKEPELSAAVRFRICDSAERFKQGQDLLDPNGDVWGYTLPELIKHRLRQGFMSVLRAENLVDEDLINDINKLDISKTVKSYLYSLSEPFIVKTGQAKRVLTYVTREKVIRLTSPVGGAFRDVGELSSTYPLTGTIRVKYELSDLPEHAKLGPTLVIRVLNIVKPITFDPLYTGPIPVPTPGQLLYRITYGKKSIVHIPIKRQQMRDDILDLMKKSWT